MTFQVVKTGVTFQASISRNGLFLYIEEEMYRIYFRCATTGTLEVEALGIIKQIK